MNIKVCGITTFKQLQQLDGLEIDMAGIVLIPGSPWYAADSLNAKEVVKADFDLKKVGILQNPSLSDALDWIDAYKLDAVQLIGDEEPQLCEDLSTEVEVIKQFSVGSDTTQLEKQLAQFDAVCDYYLFTSIYGDYSRGWILGYLKKEEFFEKAIFFKKGDVDPDPRGDKYVFPSNCFNVKVEQLNCK